jgi:hypothetical protein
MLGNSSNNIIDSIPPLLAKSIVKEDVDATKKSSKQLCYYGRRNSYPI